MSRALQTLQVAAREREIQGWVKAEVATTDGAIAVGGGLPGSSPPSCCRGSRKRWTCCTVRSTWLMKTQTRFTRVGAFATDVCNGAARICARRRLWWDKLLLNGALFRLSSSCRQSSPSLRGYWDSDACLRPFCPCDESGRRAGGHRTGAFGSGVRASAGAAGRVVTDGRPQYQDPREQAGDQKAARADAGHRRRTWR